MGKSNNHTFGTRAIHFGYNPQDFHCAISPPVFFNATYGFSTVADNESAAAQGGMLYAREFNPTVDLLEKRLANLEGAEDCIALASGMAAIGTMFLSLMSAGDELIVHETLYSNTVALIDEALPRFGIKVTPVDLTNQVNLEAAISDKTKLVFFESPVNPLGEVIDIKAVSETAKHRGVLVCVDSTFASPWLQRPIELGADLVMHSLTKYISGHGDVLGGAVLGRKEHIHMLRDRGLRYITGAVLSPMTAMLIMRGLKTLPLRMKQHAASALYIAEKLQTHPKVAWVSYAFLPSHKHYDLARCQMSAGSGMMSFGLHAGFDGARELMDGLNMIAIAVSLGEPETLIMHPASLKRARQAIRSDAARLVEGVNEDLIRLSIGLEDQEDIWADLETGLTKVSD